VVPRSIDAKEKYPKADIGHRKPARREIPPSPPPNGKSFVFSESLYLIFFKYSRVCLGA